MVFNQDLSRNLEDKVHQRTRIFPYEVHSIKMKAKNAKSLLLACQTHSKNVLTFITQLRKLETLLKITKLNLSFQELTLVTSKR